MNKSLENLLSESESYLQRGSQDANTRYISGVELEYPFYTFKKSNETTVIARKPDLEMIRQETDNKFVAYRDYIDKTVHDDIKLEHTILSRFLDQQGIGNVKVEPTFPCYLSDKLREDGFKVEVLDYNPVTESRAIKSEEEVNHIAEIQETTEKAMEKCRSMIEKSSINSNNTLMMDGEVLTSKKIKNAIIDFLHNNNATLPEGMILSCGSDTSEPHNKGSGALKSNEPIVCDIFPRSENGYFGDMTRTFCKGYPNYEFLRMCEVTSRAFEKCLDEVQSGVQGSTVYNSAARVIEDYGYSTNTGEQEGFIHSLGHGIGVEIHEKPNLNGNCGELKSGMVITIEPGVYTKDEGGVRIEDTVLVTDDGFECLNSMKRDVQIL